MAKVQVWLPKGRWYDIYTGMIYDGDRILDLYRGIESIPVLLPQEVFLRLQTKSVQCRHRKSKFLTSHGLCRANGEFELYEDDNVSCAYEERICCTTKMVYCEDENQSLQYIRLQEIGT